MSMLFVGKKDDYYCQQAENFSRRMFKDVTVLTGKRGEPFPEELKTWKGDWVVSYLSPWIIPESLIKGAKHAALNFHPGPPEYPGIGCTNFALYNNEEIFGVTCHHMNPLVDTGQLVAVRRFPVFPDDSVQSLTQRCYAHILVLYYEIMSGILTGKPLPLSSEHWTRKPYKRVELNALCETTLDMPEEEIRRRLRALTYPGMPGVQLRIAGKTFIPQE